MNLFYVFFFPTTALQKKLSITVCWNKTVIGKWVFKDFFSLQEMNPAKAI